MISPPWDFEGEKSSYNLLARAYDYLNYPLFGLGVNAKDGLKRLIEQAKRDVKTSRDIPLGEVADFTILRDVQKELGLR